MAKSSRRKKDKLDVLDLLSTRLNEYEDKKAEAESRLGETFGIFTLLKEGPCFIHGGEISPSVSVFGDFTCLCVASSNIDLQEGDEILRDANRFVSNNFSPADFRSSVALDCVSKYLRFSLEDIRSPRALAAEFLIYDHRSNVIMEVKTSGDYDIHSLEGIGPVDMNFFKVGGYDPKLARGADAWLKELKKKFKQGLSLNDLENEIKRLGIRLKVRYCGAMLMK